jgi:hypothetical protein
MIVELKNDKGNLTVIKRAEILTSIHDRVDKIWRYICDAAGVTLNWYSFSNDKHAYNNDGNGSDGGFFDPYEYGDFIDLIGEWYPSERLSVFEEGFPTKFLYSDFEKEVHCVLGIRQEEEERQKKKRKKAYQKSKQKKEVLTKLSKLSLATLNKIAKEHEL